MAPSLDVITLAPPAVTDPRPLVFVHGALHGAWCWEDNFMPYFRDRGFTTIAFSLRSHGASTGDKHIRSIRISDYVQDLRSVVDGLAHPPVLIAHSMGGFVVQKFLESRAASEPTIPLAILISSVPPNGVIGFSARMLRDHPLRFLQAVVTLKLSPMFNTPQLFRDAFMSKSLPLSEVRRHQERCGEESFAAFLDLLVMDLPKPKNVTTPIVVIGGARDVAISASESKRTARAYNTEAKIFDIAHDMMLEPNWEEVAQYILDELSRTAPGVTS
jgi:pimeloyl-ACP methyl ester carboxylesterase